MRTTRRVWPLAVVCAGVVLGQWTGVQGRQDATTFTPLFDGRSLAGWVVENAVPATFAVSDGVLRVTGAQGWLRSERQVGNGTVRVEFRFVTDDADSGVFVRAPGPASNIFLRGWPANAYQVQVRDISRNRTTNPLWIANLYRHRVPAGETTFDAAAVERTAKPTGEWQTIEIDLDGETLAVRLNDTAVTRAAGLVNLTGHIGIQAEAGIVEYRAIGVRSRD